MGIPDHLSNRSKYPFRYATIPYYEPGKERFFFRDGTAGIYLSKKLCTYKPLIYSYMMNFHDLGNKTHWPSLPVEYLTKGKIFFMKKNVGNKDRILRLLIAVFFIILVSTGVINSPESILVLIGITVFIVTASFPIARFILYSESTRALGKKIRGDIIELWREWENMKMVRMDLKICNELSWIFSFY